MSLYPARIRPAAMSAAEPTATTTPGGDAEIGISPGIQRRPTRSTTRSIGYTGAEYFSISPFLYSFPVSVRGSCASNEIDRGHL